MTARGRRRHAGLLLLAAGACRTADQYRSYVLNYNVAQDLVGHHVALSTSSRHSLENGPLTILYGTFANAAGAVDITVIWIIKT
jgi:hypothetical protein